MALRIMLLSAVAALAAGACTTTADQASADAANGTRDCFRSEQIAGYDIVDDHTIHVRINPSRSYNLSTTWNVNDLDWTTSVALRSDNGWICTGNARGRVEVTGGLLGRTYPIESVTRNPPEPGTEGS